MAWFVRGLLGLSATVVVAAAAGAASYQAHGAGYRVLHPPVDIAVGGRLIKRAKLTALDIEQLNSHLPDVLLSAEDEFIPLPARQLGYRVDTAQTAAQLSRAAPSHTLWQRLVRAFAQPSWKDLPLALLLDEVVARKQLSLLATALYRAPQSASLDIENHRRIHAVPGRALDIEASLYRVKDFALTGEGLDLAFRRLSPEVGDTDLPDVDVTQILAHYETNFRKKAGRRAINIRRAAQLIDGHILHPGEVFSFNQVVGDRTRKNGFTTAPVIVNDELEPGLGGGVCQAATTVYAAAVYAGLETVRRRSHSRPSGYAPLGLDAAVVYGKVDLRLRNSYPVALMIRAYFPSKFIMRVEWLGASPAEKVEHRYAVTEKHNFYRRVVEAPELAPGEFKRTQKGGYGYDIVSIVDRVTKEGKQPASRYSSKYYPVPEVYRVGPNTPLELLPELPEGALGLESDKLVQTEVFQEGL